jgi:hypothetical protein
MGKRSNGQSNERSASPAAPKMALHVHRLDSLNGQESSVNGHFNVCLVQSASRTEASF